MKRNAKDYIGLKINHWTILSDEGRDRWHKVLVKARCDCGHERVQRLDVILNGRSKCCINCGKANFVKMNFKHGLRYTHICEVWLHMKARCYNIKHDKYMYYGGRGIKVCDEWKSDFKAFYDWAMTNGYDEGLTIDRIDVNGNYEPGNCRWASKSLQAINQRKSIRNTSGYVGLSMRNSSKGIVWRVWVDVERKHNYLGAYFTQKEALAVRNKFIEDHNLPHKIQEYRGELGDI